MAEQERTNLEELLAEIAGSKAAAATSHYSYVMGVFDKSDADAEAKDAEKSDKC
jgi:hypothetical protein